MGLKDSVEIINTTVRFSKEMLMNKVHSIPLLCPVPHQTILRGRNKSKMTKEERFEKWKSEHPVSSPITFQSNIWKKQYKKQS